MYVAGMRGYRGETRYRLWEYKLARPGCEYVPSAFNLSGWFEKSRKSEILIWDKYIDKAKFSLEKDSDFNFHLMLANGTNNA